MLAKVYARKGETITCENGHPICEFADDVYVGNLPKPSNFINWTQEEPEFGSRPKCAVCNGDFWVGGEGFRVHIGDAWRIGVS